MTTGQQPLPHALLLLIGDARRQIGAVADAMASARICLAPLRFGAGLKGKVKRQQKVLQRALVQLKNWRGTFIS
jgi:hypothetical protein